MTHQVWDKSFFDSDTSEVVFTGSKQECRDYIKARASWSLHRYFIAPVAPPQVQVRKRSGISGDRAYRIQVKLRQRLLDTISNCIHFHTTAEYLSAQVGAVFGNPDLKRAPRYVSSYLRGVWDTKREDIQQHHLVWLLYCDGSLLTSEQVDELTLKEHTAMWTAFCTTWRKIPTLQEFIAKLLPSDYKSPWSRINSELSRHVWKDAQGNPLVDKPYDSRFLRD